jgi:hypothetical protein
VASVIALLEFREARAREELESWLEVVREAEEHAASARQRLEHARIACDEVLRAFAEEGEAAGGAHAAPAVAAEPDADSGRRVDPETVPDLAVAAVAVPVLRPGYDPRPPVRVDGMSTEVLSGVYRQLFMVVASASGPVSAQDLTHGLGRDASRLNEVEKVRHRAYALVARGWLVRERGLFRPAAGPAGGGGARASAGAGGPSSA